MNVKLIKEIIKAQPKAFILVLVLLLANAGLLVHAYVYQAPRLADLQDKWFAKRKSATGGALVDTAAVFRQGEDDLKEWRSRIIPKRGFARFVGQLFETAANNSLAFKGVSYKATPLTDENLVTYALDFNVTGKYAAIKSFMADMGRIREIMTIDNISLNADKVTEDDVALKVQLTVYLRMEQQ